MDLIKLIELFYKLHQRSGTLYSCNISEIDGVKLEAPLTFIWSTNFMVNQKLFQREFLWEVLNVFGIDNESYSISWYLESIIDDPLAPLETLDRYKKLWKNEYVAQGNYGIFLKTFKDIEDKMLKWLRDVKVKSGKSFVFYSEWIPMIYIESVKMDSQTSLL